MRKLLCLLLTAVMLMTAGTVPGFGEEFVSEEPPVREPGFCGEDVKWSYENGVLTV